MATVLLLVTFLNTVLFLVAVSCSGCDAVSLSLEANSEHNCVGGGGNNDTENDKHNRHIGIILV